MRQIYVISCALAMWDCGASAASQCRSACGEINIGRPKLWSLGDAQYLVGQAREKLKALRVALPGESQSSRAHNTFSLVSG